MELFGRAADLTYLLQFRVPVALIDLRLFHQAALAILFPSRVPASFAGPWNNILAHLSGIANNRDYPDSANWFIKLFSTNFSDLATYYRGKHLSEVVTVGEHLEGEYLAHKKDLVCRAVLCTFWGINNLQADEVLKWEHTTANAALANSLFGGPAESQPARSGERV